MAVYLHDIYTLLLIFALLVFTTIFFLDKKRFLLLLEFLFNQKYIVIYHRPTSLVYNFFTSINILIICTILISFYIFHIKEGALTFYVFFKISIILLSSFLLKTLINQAIGSLFELQEYSKKYNYHYQTSLFFLSVVFFPVILFISYYNGGELIAQFCIYILYIFLFSYFILKLILLKRLNLFKIRFMFYNILYLCGLEALLYISVFKLLQVIC